MTGPDYDTLEPGGDSGYVCEHGYSEPHGEDGVVEASYEAAGCF